MTSRMSSQYQENYDASAGGGDGTYYDPQQQYYDPQQQYYDPQQQYYYDETTNSNNNHGYDQTAQLADTMQNQMNMNGSNGSSGGVDGYQQPQPQQQQQQQQYDANTYGHIQTPAYRQMHQMQQQQQQQQQQPPLQPIYTTPEQQQQQQQQMQSSASTSSMLSDSTLSPKASNARIDPKQIPRAETEAVGAVPVDYLTNSGTVPPPSTSQYRVVDEGNCSPRFVRMTCNQIAFDDELIESTKVQIGAIVQPLADVGRDEYPVSVVDTRETGPLRCERCRAYVNPFFQFVADGRKFICNLCHHQSTTPDHYYCNVDANGLRRDRDQRPELLYGSVDFVVSNEYVMRTIQPPAYVFVMEVSPAAYMSGLVHTVIAGIQYSLDYLVQCVPTARVGIITYHSSVHYYSLSRSEPQLFVVADVDEAFVPVRSDDLLVSLADPERRKTIDDLLAMLLDLHKDEVAHDAPTAFGAAVAGAAKAVAKCSGSKVLMFQASMPSVGCGALTNRENSNLYNTDKEAGLMMPSSPFYEQLAVESAESAISIDLYVCANMYVDLATLATLSTTTGGQVYYYRSFQQAKDNQALQMDIYTNLTRATGFDGVMIVRVSEGLKVEDHFGNFYRRRPQEMELPTIDSHKAFGVVFGHETKLSDKSKVSIQCGLLYTTALGERRIRVHTLQLSVTSVMGNVYRYSDLDSVVALSLKQASKQVLRTSTPEEVRAALVDACVTSLFVYRKFCASASSPRQLILPEPLKLLPLNTLGLIKHPLLHSGMPADERAFLVSFVSHMPTYAAIPFIVPRLFDVSNIPDGCCEYSVERPIYLPPTLSLSPDTLDDEGVYLLDDGLSIYLWVGHSVDPAIVADLFDLDPDPANHPPLSTWQISAAHYDDPSHISTQVQAMLFKLREQSPRYSTISIVRRSHDGVNTTLDEEQFLKHFLEAAGTPSRGYRGKEKDASAMTYTDFLCEVHKRIQSKFM